MGMLKVLRGFVVCSQFELNSRGLARAGLGRNFYCEDRHRLIINFRFDRSNPFEGLIRDSSPYLIRLSIQNLPKTLYSTNKTTGRSTIPANGGARTRIFFLAQPQGDPCFLWLPDSLRCLFGSWSALLPGLGCSDGTNPNCSGPRGPSAASTLSKHPNKLVSDLKPPRNLQTN